MTKSIIITGAGRGIGAATAQAFLDAGYRVGLIGRNEDTLTATADEQANALVLTCDVGEPDQVEAAFARAYDDGGGLMYCSTMPDAAARLAPSTRLRSKTGSTSSGSI